MELAYPLIRIFLGLALSLRGLLFVSDPESLTRLAASITNYWFYSYIGVAHLIGGMFLAAGYFTRFAALIQMPILIGAVFVVHIKQGLLTSGQSLEISVLVLFLLTINVLFGAGNLSFDNRKNAR